ncbi:MAG: hypothetical protein ABJE47_00130 [bacterium]
MTVFVSVAARGARVVGAVVMLGTAARAADAQSPPATIPTVLATSVIGPFFGGLGFNVAFVAGRAPEKWPASLLPLAPATIIGGAMVGPIATAVFGYPAGTSATQSYGALLKGAGFREVAGSPVSWDGDHGFAPNRPNSFRSTSYCGKNGAVGITTTDSSQSGTVIAVSFAGGSELEGPCGGTPQPDRTPPVNIPLLTPPHGVRTETAGNSWGNDNVEVSARVDSTLASDAILSHYAAQLAAAGWQVTAKPAVGDGIVVRQVSTHGRGGEPWRGLLMVITGNSDREVVLRVMRDRERTQ